jgi:two-component system LytT family sensor kinase
MFSAAFWAGWFALWSMFGLVLFSQDFAESIHAGQPQLWRPLLFCWLTRAYTWGLLSLVVRWLARRFPIERGSLLRALALHFPFSAIVSLIAAALISSVGSLLGIPWYLAGFRTTFPSTVATTFLVDLFTYWVVLALWQALDAYRKYQEQKQCALESELQLTGLRAELADARLAALKNQLQPHFLFNTLNGIMALVRRKDTTQAEEMLVRLSALLRFILRDSDAQEVSLGNELDFVRLYLSIEAVRFKDRLQVEIDVRPELLHAMVPTMCLQPLVENAIRHGIGRTSDAGKVTVRSRRSGSKLTIEVQDNGSLHDARVDSEGVGIGLSNTRARLHSLYGDSARFCIERAEYGGTVARILIPYRSQAPRPVEKKMA